MNPPIPVLFRTLALVGLLTIFPPSHGHADWFSGQRFSYREFLEVLLKSPFPLPSGNSVLVIGNVQRPGEVKYGDGIPASKAIQDAGGLGRYPRSHSVGIWKNAEGRFVPFDLQAVIDKVPSAKDPILASGDVVIVLPRMFDNF